MMKAIKRYLFVLIITVTTFLNYSIPATATGYTRSDAVAWANARANEAWCVNVDGQYGCQCVDLILGYYDYLVGYHVSGNAKDYATNSLPAGWSRSSTPAPGAVVVWGAGAQLEQHRWADNTYGHIGIVVGVDGSSITTVETNVYSDNPAAGIYYGRFTSGVLCYIHPDFQPETGTLDLNGLLDGWQEGGLLDYGTCDVYINGSLAADRTNTTDYVDSLPAGTTYLITNIKANEGFSYEGLASGSAALSGTIQSGVTTDVRLKFNSCKLDVNGWLDNEECGTLLDYGTFDLYVNDVKIIDDTDDFWDRLPKGATYEIKDIKATPGHVYNGPYSGSLKGTIVSGRTNVSLSFSTTGEISSDWITVNKLPGNINSTICDIEYKHTYQTTAQSSPGSGWSQVPGSGITTYENVGEVEETVFAKTESETCELVGSYYYHFCGPSAYGAEYYQTGGYINRHVAGSPDQYDVVGTFEDSHLHSSLYQYQLRNKYGQWAGQPSLCSDERTDRWYLMYQYQNKRAVTTYTWSKDSDWTTTADSAATSVQYRYRLKSSLTKLVLPANLTVIEDEAFAGAMMNAVIVPDGCTAISSRAFANCSELVFVSVPKGTVIAADAFEGCGSVTVNERS